MYLHGWRIRQVPKELADSSTACIRTLSLFSLVLTRVEVMGQQLDGRYRTFAPEHSVVSRSCILRDGFAECSAACSRYVITLIYSIVANNNRHEPLLLVGLRVACLTRSLLFAGLV